MTKQDVAANDAKSAPPVLPEKVDPNAVKMNSEGWAFREIVIHLPAGVTATALNDDPSLFQKVQGDVRTALRQLDRVILIGANQEWLAEGWVSGADTKSATIAVTKIVRLEARQAALFSDGEMAVVYLGAAGYGVRRLRDGHLMVQGLANASIAERWLTNYHVVKV